MEKTILVIRKQDKTVHRAQLHQKAFLTSYNNRLPTAQKFTIEEMDEDEAIDLPFIDKSYVTAGEATKKLSVVTKQLVAKDQEIENLKARLEALQNPGGQNGAITQGPGNTEAGAGQEDKGSIAANLNTTTDAKDGVAMQSANTTAQALPVNYERLSNPKLMEELTKRGIAYDPGTEKKELVKLLKSDDFSKAKK